MTDPTENGVIVVGVDYGDKDLTAMVVALAREGKLEIVHCMHVEPHSTREDEIKAAVAQMEPLELAPPLPAPSSLPYWRRFERKRRAR